jgi:hypothetical protein
MSNTPCYVVHERQHEWVMINNKIYSVHSGIQIQPNVFELGRRGCPISIQYNL